MASGRNPCVPWLVNLNLNYLWRTPSFWASFWWCGGVMWKSVPGCTHSEQRINIGIARSRTLDHSSEFEPFLTTFSAPLARVQSNQDIPDQDLPCLLQHYESSPIHRYPEGLERSLPSWLYLAYPFAVEALWHSCLYASLRALTAPKGKMKYSETLWKHIQLWLMEMNQNL